MSPKKHKTADQRKYSEYEYKTAFGNLAGLSILENFASLEARIADIEKHTKVLREKTEVVKGQSAVLQDRSDELVAHSQGFRSTRHRSIETYLRDIKSQKGHSQQKVDQSNAADHHADAVADAILYDLGKRDDIAAMESIYGVSPDMILHLKKHRRQGLINVLNKHANLVVKTELVLTTGLRHAFVGFIMVLKNELRANSVPPDLNDPKSPLNSAYVRYNDEHKKFQK